MAEQRQEPMTRERAHERVERMANNFRLKAGSPTYWQQDHAESAAALQYLLDENERKTKALEEIMRGYGKFGYYYAFQIAAEALKDKPQEGEKTGG